MNDINNMILNNLSSHYIFFYIVPGNEKILEQWIQKFHPQLKKSYTQSGWATYKSTVPLNLTFFRNFRCPIALRTGLGFAIGTKEYVSPIVHKLQQLYPVLTTQTWTADEIIRPQMMQTPPQFILSMMSVSPREYCLGISEFLPHHLQSPHPSCAIPLESQWQNFVPPSRAFFKLQQINYFLQLDFRPKDWVLELGCAPGGISSFFLQQQLNVLGVDQGEMDVSVKKHSQFTSIKNSVQRLNPEMPQLQNKDIDWLISDMNISPDQMSKEVARICTFPQCHNLKGIIVHVKIVQPDKIIKLQKFAKIIHENIQTDFYKYNVDLCHIPAHKQEVALIFLRQ